MSLADEVRTVRQRVVARLEELEPLVREYEELVRLAGELGIDAPVVERAHSTRSSRARAADVAGDNGEIADAESTPARPDPATRPSGAASSGGRGRRAPANADADPERDARVLDALRQQPGMTTAELATLLGVPATSLYRPVRELTTSGAIVKRGRGLYVS
jgi:hypothetical protein